MIASNILQISKLYQFQENTIKIFLPSIFFLFYGGGWKLLLVFICISSLKI